MRRTLSILLVLLCLALASACMPQSFTPTWTAADLRWLGSSEAAAPDADLLAVYTLSTALTIDIRLDLLDINPGDNYRVELDLWDNRAFAQAPIQIEIHSNGAVLTSGVGLGKPFLWPRVIQDDAMDTITISLNRGLLGSRYRLDVATFDGAASQPSTQALDVRSDGLPPTGRAATLVEFWNTFPAVTPAQALRRWDGAHTGPLGDRHGLKHVLDNAKTYHVPVALLDLKTPSSLAALNMVGPIWQAQIMYSQGLLILPDVAYSQPIDKALAFARQSDAGFNMPDSPFVYAPGMDRVPGYAAQFAEISGSDRLALDGGTRLIPMPAGQALEAGPDGPSLEARRALAAAASSNDPGRLVVLGGSLPDSAWGDSDLAGPSFAWLAGHPWIHFLDGPGLLAFPVEEKASLPAASASESTGLLADLRSAPANALSDSAWLAYLTLTAPTSDERLQGLQQDYLGQVTELLAAARWASAPSDQADCSRDVNGDGQPECVLSSRTYFAVIDPNGGRLSNLVYLDAQGPHQLVAPSSQFAVGLSDPSEWKPGAGEAADPSVIPGAFLDGQAWERFSAAALPPDRVSLHSANGSLEKDFTLTSSGLSVAYRGNQAIDTRLPVLVDPLSFYLGPVQYLSDLTSHTWTWSVSSGLAVRVRSDPIPLTAQGFIASYPFLALPENPNLDYPLGHYYPFPLSVVDLRGQGDFTVVIGVPTGK